jgi:hypothetical protein
MEMSRINQEQLCQAVDRLGRAYDFELDPAHVPDTCRDEIYHAATRLSSQQIDMERMSFAQEVGDLTYQLVKALAVRGNVLERDDQGRLHEQCGDEFRPGAASLSIFQVYDMAYGLLEEKRVRTLEAMLPLNHFYGPVARDFIANQYVSYIARLYREEAGYVGFHTEEFIRENKIPEEMGELVEVILFRNMPAWHEQSMDGLGARLQQAGELVESVREAMDSHDYGSAFGSLDGVLKGEVREDIGLQDALRFVLFKIRMRQELEFRDYDRASRRAACKTIEYFLEADMVMNGTRYNLSQDT